MISDRLLETVLRCPSCARSGTLQYTADAVHCRACRAAFPDVGGVLDLLAPRPPRPVPSAIETNGANVAHALIEKLGLSGQDAMAERFRRVTEPLAPIGEPFFDAEEELFLERWQIFNTAVSIHLGPVYHAPAMAAGGETWVAVRIANYGPFPLRSGGEHPFALSYHWFKGEGCVEYEGLRSGLQLDLQPGRELTTHLRVKAPSQSGPHTLRIVPIVEGVAWYEEFAIETAIDVGTAPPDPPDANAGIPFTESDDNALSLRFIDRHLDLPPGATLVEIGGGIRPILRESAADRFCASALINCDVSVRLLRVAAILSDLNGTAANTYHMRLDANAMPIEDASLDGAIFCRSLHHFQDLGAILGEVHRVLRPGGRLVLLCEPVGHMYDAYTVGLIERGVNEQVFPSGAYAAVAQQCGFVPEAEELDWGFSYKGVFLKA
jgi:SAM-dependent methyltransferase